VYTTAEMVLGECVGHVFTRERDDETGFHELVVTTKLAVAPPPRRRNGSGGSEASVASAKAFATTRTEAGEATAERRSDRDALSKPSKDGEDGDAAGRRDGKRRGFFGWLGSVVAPDPPANYATDVG
jgi:hypothetical protein